ncbi:hypothetical protein A1QO_00645 [Vibrio genomosp. F10 str. ZF-129]|uniref:Uncharacterized protein n=1 Tax=Vibrio genomosp. F10 str. ZF-129 TaxID=1187848 RepID=A0A1E5BGK1_9VIBR|nr:conjugal transfer protein TraG N-terminal domain-containing protein [Vibrio genomosp. F10]OEE35300.1 hypothetical protein A1QO_00645 [Vibrio genomosp. F10 str. ZF-129]
MLQANDYLDIFMLPMGFFIHNRLFEILEMTGLIWLPFLVIAVKSIVDARLAGLSGEEAMASILAVIETRYVMMALVVMVAVSPVESVGVATPTSVKYEVTSCNDKYRRVLVGESVQGVREGFEFTHDIESYTTLAYGLTNMLSTATVNSVIATLPCTIGYRDYQHIFDNTNLKNEKTKRLVDAFSTQCYIPALSKILRNHSIEYDFQEDAYFKVFGVMAPDIVDQYGSKDPQLIMTTKISDWDIPPADNMLASDSISQTCLTSFNKIKELILNDPYIQRQVTLAIELGEEGTNSYMQTLTNVGSPDLKYVGEDLDNLKTYQIQKLFRSAVGQGLMERSPSRLKLPEVTGGIFEFTESTVSWLVSAIGSIIAWGIAIGTAGVAVDLIPWMISIFQGVVASFFIIILFFNAYSGRSLMIVIGTVVALEFGMLALELAIWIDNIVFTILKSKLTSFSTMDPMRPQGIFLAGMAAATIYIGIPTFTYKWLSQNIGAGMGHADITGNAAQVGQAGAVGLLKLLSKGGKMGMGAAKAGKDKLASAAKAGENINNSLNG